MNTLQEWALPCFLRTWVPYSDSPSVVGVRLGQWSSPLLSRIVLLVGAPEITTFNDLRADLNPD